jgi:D-arabinitol dehydrogenase (NADP+)
VHGLDVLQLRTGSDMLLVGIGPTGLILAQLLRAAGAGRATVAGRTPFEPEPEPEPELAAAYGADGTVRLTGDPDADGGTLLVYGMADETARVASDLYDVSVAS